MSIAENTTYRNGDRFYPCVLCRNEHPSTTTILDVIGSKALMGWSQKMGTKKLLMFAKEIRALITEETYHAASKATEDIWKKDGEASDFWKSGTQSSKDAADHGTMAHAAFEMHLKGKQVDDQSLSGPARAAFGIFREYASSNKIETIDTETTFYNCQIGYAGTADWRGTINGKLTLADWKTSTGIFEKNVIQCWANAIADEMMNGNNLYQQVLVGRFGKDGSTDILIVPRNGLEDGFCGYEQARELIQACVPWFHFKKNWEEKFPYKKKEIK